ncbi:hypothetical protein M758_UG042500 [Ceratodon purpureus]|nr:hypothetical protein M758_UG042500 [Ceratodon purpureus]
MYVQWRSIPAVIICLQEQTTRLLICMTCLHFNAICLRLSKTTMLVVPLTRSDILPMEAYRLLPAKMGVFESGMA